MLTTLQIIHPKENAVEWRVLDVEYSFGLIGCVMGSDTFHKLNGWFCLYVYW